MMFGFGNTDTMLLLVVAMILVTAITITYRMRRHAIFSWWS